MKFVVYYLNMQIHDDEFYRKQFTVHAAILKHIKKML